MAAFLASRRALLAALLLAPVAGRAQSPDPWYAGVWEIDAATVIVMGADWGQEVRSGRAGTLRHGLRVPLEREPTGDTVRFEPATLPTHASRWVLHRTPQGVIIEEWTRAGGPEVAWRLVRAPPGTAGFHRISQSLAP